MRASPHSIVLLLLAFTTAIMANSYWVRQEDRELHLLFPTASNFDSLDSLADISFSTRIVLSIRLRYCLSNISST